MWVDVSEAMATQLESLNTIYFIIHKPARPEALINNYLATHGMLGRTKTTGQKGWLTRGRGPNIDAKIFAEGLKPLEVLSKLLKRRSERVKLITVDPDDNLLEEGRTASANGLSEVE